MQIMQTDNLLQIQNNLLHIETPTKKSRKQQVSEQNTADSIALTDQKSNSLNDIDAQQLFERFHEIIRISEVEENEPEQATPQTVYRKLDYDSSQQKYKKLQFSMDMSDRSSMTKKNKVQNGKCLSGRVKGKQLFQVIRINSPKKTDITMKSFINGEENQVLTPTKREKENFHCQMTAKKESPYRDLIRRD